MVEILDVEAYLVNHQNDYIRVINMYTDETKKGSSWLKDFYNGEFYDEWNMEVYEDDEADYYTVRIELI